MNSRRIFPLAGLVVAAFAGCGPDRRPDEPCDGPTFNLVVTAENGPLPPDTRINVRYGGNQDGEPYALSDSRQRQAVFCDRIGVGAGGASGSAGAGSSGADAGDAPSDTPSVDAVEALHCRLYTQGPARLDVTASGYQPVDDLPLSLDGKKNCDVPFDVVLMPYKNPASP